MARFPCIFLPSGIFLLLLADDLHPGEIELRLGYGWQIGQK
jgi:hypothetical protein